MIIPASGTYMGSGIIFVLYDMTSRAVGQLYIATQKRLWVAFDKSEGHPRESQGQNLLSALRAAAHPDKSKSKSFQRAQGRPPAEGGHPAATACTQMAPLGRGDEPKP